MNDQILIGFLAGLAIGLSIASFLFVFARRNLIRTAGEKVVTVGPSPSFSLPPDDSEGATKAFTEFDLEEAMRDREDDFVLFVEDPPKDDKA